MVKRREPAKAVRQPSPEEIEAFASGADRAASETVLDSNANRDFKAIRVPFNEYEYRKLEEVATKLGRTKLNVIRWAILKLAEEAQD
jgi:hypothetical protein